MHEVAGLVNRDARIDYADNDPLVLAHARALLTSAPEGRTAYIQADLWNPAAILSDPTPRLRLLLSDVCSQPGCSHVLTADHI